MRKFFVKGKQVNLERKIARLVMVAGEVQTNKICILMPCVLCEGRIIQSEIRIKRTFPFLGSPIISVP